MAKLNPFVLRDFSQGRYNPSNVSNFLAPPNSVSYSLNINFDTILGSGVVRNGTTLLGSAVASGFSPLGLAEFTQKNGNHIALSVFSGVTNATLYYFSGSWVSSNLTSLSNTFKCRFATLGGSEFIVNGVVMYSSTDGATWNTGAAYNCIATADFQPSLIYRYDAQLLVSGDSTYRSRIFFSSVVDPTATPFITWNSDSVAGDFIDVNPDDGGVITGFSEASTFLLVFKDIGMYRMDVVDKTVDPENIFNVGAVSQESITLCQGVVYYYSGLDIRQTNGGYPEQISRMGVQDIIDAIPLANQTTVAAGTDGINVFFSVGDITLNADQDNETVINNCVLKFCPQDQTWSVHSYADEIHFFANHTNTSTFWGGQGTFLYGATTSGDVQALDVGMTDGEVHDVGPVDTVGAPIYFQLSTQELEFGSRAHWKNISDKIIVYNNFAIDSDFQCLINGETLKDIPINLTDRVNIGKDIDLGGNFFKFIWSGQSNKTPPIFEGFELNDIVDVGIQNSAI